jgi:PAS domain S-box-containing protein
MERSLQQLLDGAPEAILVADRDGLIRYWNSGAEQIFGHGGADAIGQSLDLIIPEALRGRHWDGYWRVMASGETKYKTGLLTSPGIRKDGSRVSLEFSMVLLHDDGGALCGCAAIMRDVTVRWQQEKQLKEKLAACEAKLVPETAA